MAMVKPLLLAGGKSSRMGFPKHLLQLPNGQPLYTQLIQTFCGALLDLDTMYVSFAKDSAVDNGFRKEITPDTPDQVNKSKVKIEIVWDDTHEDIGPAAGLLSAFHQDPNATWLVVACDYPLIHIETLRQLLDEYEAPVTCFQNADGFCEPFLGIWSPKALSVLEENVKAGKLGPSRTVKEAGGKLIKPALSASGETREWWLTNVNTKEEWEKAKDRLG